MSFTLLQVTQRAAGGEIVRTKRFDADEITIGRGADCELQLPDLAVSLRHARMARTGPGKVRVEALAGQSFESGGRFVSQANLNVADRPQLVFGNHILTLEPGATADEVVVNVARAEAATAPSTLDEEVRTFSPQAVGLSKRAMAWTFGLLIVAVCLIWPITAFYGQLNPRIHADSQWESGHLSRVHAFLEKDCQACHKQAFVAVRDEACLTCHRAGQPAAVKLATIARVRSKGSTDTPHFVWNHADHDRLLAATPLPKDFGGKVKAVVQRTFNHDETRCASCHREHLDAKGQRPAAGAPPSTVTAGKASVPDKPTLVLTQDCAACHGQLKARLSDTALIDTPDWNRHPDFRPLITVSLGGAQPTLARVALSQNPSEPTGLKFPHRLHLLTTRGVARMGQELGAGRGYGGALDCGSCHRPDATGKGFQPVEMNRDCGACHSLAYARNGGELKLLPHGHPDQVAATLKAFYAGMGPIRMVAPNPSAWSRRLPGQAAEAGAQTRAWTTGASPAAAVSAIRAVFSPGGACYDCHTVRPPAGADPTAWTIAPVRLNNRYLPRGGFDHGVRQHRQTADGRQICGDCHRAETSDRSEDLLLPKIAQCAACHGKTVRPAGVQTFAPAASDCAECHSYHSPAQPGRPVRAEDRWAIAGRSVGGR
jgi:hypothetical protein